MRVCVDCGADITSYMGNAKRCRRCAYLAHCGKYQQDMTYSVKLCHVCNTEKEHWDASKTGCIDCATERYFRSRPAKNPRVEPTVQYTKCLFPECNTMIAWTTRKKHHCCDDHRRRCNKLGIRVRHPEEARGRRAKKRFDRQYGKLINVVRLQDMPVHKFLATLLKAQRGSVVLTK